MKTYTVHVSMPGTGRVWRKIEMRADQSLAHLHMAIQSAFGWGAGHLYSFYMSGRAWDRGTEYCLPEDADPWSTEAPPSRKKRGDKAGPDVSPELEDLLKRMLFDHPDAVEIARRRLGDKFDNFAAAFAEPGDAREAALDSLNLKIGQKLLYLYDYGDEWRFTVRVHAINVDAPVGEYPRVVEAVGELPPSIDGF